MLCDFLHDACLSVGLVWLIVVSGVLDRLVLLICGCLVPFGGGVCG